MPEALHFRENDHDQDLSLHPAQIACAILRSGHAARDFYQVQTCSLPKDTSANLQPSRRGGKRSQDPRAADLDQGCFVDQQQTATGLGCRSVDDKTAVRLKPGGSALSLNTPLLIRPLNLATRPGSLAL